MSTLSIRLPDTKHQRLKAFARARSISLHNLVEEWAIVALAQIDTEKPREHTIWDVDVAGSNPVTPITS